MPLTTRYGFADTPHPGNPSLAWTLLTNPSLAGATSIVLDDVSAFPSATEFDIEIGERQIDGTVSNLDVAHVLSISGNTLTLQSALTYAHAAMESVYHPVTALGLKHNPQALTDAGDFPFLNSSGRMDRLGQPGDGDWILRWLSGVPSYISSSGLYVPLTRTVNGHALNSNVTVTASDVGLGSVENAAASGLYVPLSRTVNGHALSSNVVVSATDLTTGMLPLARLSALTTTQFASAAISQWTNDAGYVTSSGIGGSINDTQVAFGSGASIAGSANFTWVPPIFSVGGSTTARIDWKTTSHTVDMKLTNITNFFSVTGAGSYSFDATVNATAFAYPDISGDTQVQFNNAGAISGSASLTWDTDLHVNGSIVATAASVTAFTNKSGNISQWTNDSGYLTSGTAGHNVLSSTHSDTLAGSVVRGDLIYGNSTPKWARLAAPGVLSGLSHDGTDVSWVTATGTGAPARSTSPTFVTPVLGVASSTSLATSAASPLLLTNGKLVTVALTTQTINPTTLTIPDFASVSDTFAFVTLIQTLANKTLTTPTIASFVNATHTHLNAAGGGTITAAAVSDLNSATVIFTNKSGNISQWTNDSGYVAAHNLLSATHSDTTASSVVRGDVITGQAASPLWKRLALGAANAVLSSDGTDVAWVASTGTGNNVRATSPTLVTPALGVATATSLNGNSFTTGTYTLTGTAGKTLTFSKTLTIDGTDGTTMTFPTTSATVARTDAGQTFTGAQTYSGQVLGKQGTATSPSFTYSGSNDLGWYFPDTGTIGFARNGDFGVLDNNGWRLRSGQSFGFSSSSTAPYGTGADVTIYRDASGVLAQRNGTAAQTSRLYETYTDASNYSRLSISAPSGGPITFASEAAGTGTVRSIQLNPGTTGLVQHGADVNAAAQAQTIQAANAITGSNLAGGNLTLRPGTGMGTGTVSALIIQTPTIAASGASAQVQAERARWDSSGLTIADAHNVILSGTTGTKFGTATSQKMSWWNATPVIQQSRVGQLTDSTTGTPATTLVDVGVVFSQAAINNNFSSVLTKLNALDSLLHTLGLSA